MRRQVWMARRLQPTLTALMAALVSAIVTLPTSVLRADEVLVSIGTGELNGVYYPVGKAICAIVNQDIRSHGIRCSPETTPGSVYNIDALRSGELDFAIVNLPREKHRAVEADQRLPVEALKS